jgi:acyl-CoA thioester hydrolase
MSETGSAHVTNIRVRYAETDQMGFVHHANYLVYFEIGRTELLRSTGLDYKSIEEKGYRLVVAKIDIKYRSPARYDDELLLETRIKRVTPVRIEHMYRILRGNQLIVEGESTLACVDLNGNLCPLPPEIAPPG